MQKILSKKTIIIIFSILFLIGVSLMIYYLINRDENMVNDDNELSCEEIIQKTYDSSILAPTNGKPYSIKISSNSLLISVPPCFFNYPKNSVKEPITDDGKIDKNIISDQSLINACKLAKKHCSYSGVIPKGATLKNLEPYNNLGGNNNGKWEFLGCKNNIPACEYIPPDTTTTDIPLGDCINCQKIGTHGDCTGVRQTNYCLKCVQNPEKCVN